VRSDNAAEVLDSFKDIDPELAELRTAANRPYAQFTNTHANAFLADIPHFIVLRTLTQLFTIHANAELASGHSDRAFADIHVVRRVADALSNQSTLRVAMMRVAILGLTLQPFESGLSTNAWSDEQLVAFQKYFESINLLADMDVALRGGERNGVTRLVEDMPRKQFMEMMTSAGSKDWKDHCFKLAAALVSARLVVSERGQLQPNNAEILRRLRCAATTGLSAKAGGREYVSLRGTRRHHAVQVSHSPWSAET
jgi:hypothetical protein